MTENIEGACELCGVEYNGTTTHLRPLAETFKILNADKSRGADGIDGKENSWEQRVRYK